MTAPRTAATASGVSCKHLAEQIRLTKAYIKAEETQIKTKTARLHALRHEPHPDAKAIERLQVSIHQLEEDLAEDRGILATQEADFQMRCSG
jgi:hypothetical protein